MPLIRVTYFLEVLSSWCHWAEPTWAKLQSSYNGIAEFEWKIALMDAAGYDSYSAHFGSVPSS